MATGSHALDRTSNYLGGRSLFLVLGNKCPNCSKSDAVTCSWSRKYDCLSFSFLDTDALGISTISRLIEPDEYAAGIKMHCSVHKSDCGHKWDSCTFDA